MADMSWIDPQLHTILVCPRCKGELRLLDSERTLACDACGRTYLVNAAGVPIMTVEDD